MGQRERPIWVLAGLPQAQGHRSGPHWACSLSCQRDHCVQRYRYTVVLNTRSLNVTLIRCGPSHPLLLRIWCSPRKSVNLISHLCLQRGLFCFCAAQTPGMKDAISNTSCEMLKLESHGRCHAADSPSMPRAHHRAENCCPLSPLPHRPRNNLGYVGHRPRCPVS